VDGWGASFIEFRHERFIQTFIRFRIKPDSCRMQS
jgi:hypothetical protein